jgi:Pyridine nucleotide-disulphide oxidoreductase
MEACDVVIVGAGPYGLSAAAYLQGIPGLEVKLFGKPMSFWEQCMPPSMLLRSHWHATHIASPGNRSSLDVYTSRNGDRGLTEPIPGKAFVRYGKWFHNQLGVKADSRKVTDIRRGSSGLDVALEDGTSVRASRVLVATGIESYAHKPAVFSRAPRELVSHSSELRDYNAFRDKEVIVIGGGQSALESAAFLHVGGARVEILVRASGVCRRPRFAGFRKLIDPKRLKFLYGRGGVGSAGLSQLIQRPRLYAYLPPERRGLWDRKSTKLGFSFHLVPALNGTPLRYSQSVDRVCIKGGRLDLRLGDGSSHAADHVVLGTGYRVDLSRCEFLTPEILRDLRLVDGYPVLDAGLESSIPGLHFLGAPAAYSFGPLVRFVAGTEFAASAVARRIRQAKKRPT